LQGEIGHLEVVVEFAGVPVSLRCDCGGLNHLNAFTSGRGLEALVHHLAGKPDSGFETSSLARVQRGELAAAFLAAVNDGDLWSRAVLASALRPLARILAVMLTHDPELDPIVFVGGVASTLRGVFLNTVIDELEGLGMYQVTDRDPDYFRRRLRLGYMDDDSGLIGCGLHTQTTSS
jgi:glucokinase